MKKILVITSVSVLIALGVACTPKKPKTAATEEAIFTKELVSKQFSSEQIASGEAIFNAKCGTCHKLHKPSQFGEERWNKVMDRMIPKTDANAQEGKLMRAYAVANARQAS